MRRIVSVTAALAATVAMMGAGGGCKEQRKGHVDSDRPPAEKQVDVSKARRVGIEVHGTGPYSVFVHVQRADGKGGSDQTRETVAGGTYTQTLDYTSGVRLRVRVSVTGNINDKFSCKLIDGLPKPDKDALPDGPAVNWNGPDGGKTYCGAVTSG